MRFELPWGYESTTTATVFHHKPHNPIKPERIAPSRVAYVAYAPYTFYEVWQKSGKDITPRSEHVFVVAPIRSMTAYSREVEFSLHGGAIHFSVLYVTCVQR